jgi:hypothetical protein
MFVNQRPPNMYDGMNVVPDGLCKGQGTCAAVEERIFT